MPAPSARYIPRTGAFVVKPFADYEGDAKGAICLDTLGLGLGFSEENLALVSEVAAKVSYRPAPAATTVTTVTTVTTAVPTPFCQHRPPPAPPPAASSTPSLLLLPHILL